MMKPKKRSLRAKIFTAIISVVLISMLCLSAMFFYNTSSISDTLLASNEEMSQTSSDMSSASMDRLSQDRLQEMADNKADIADNVFAEYERAVKTLASAAARLYADPSRYSYQEVPLPEIEKDGQLSIQTLYAEETDPKDSAVDAELGLVGNIQDLLYIINDNNPSMASIYVASESGFVVMSDYISGKKFDADGKILPLDARERPWYQGAKEAGGPYFTPVTQDSHTTRRGIMCGVPIYRDGVLMGVAGAGMYLDDIDTLVQNVDFGEDGDACIINQYGQVLFSTFKDGTLIASADGQDVRETAEADLAGLVDKAAAGGRGVELVSIDGAMEYVAYAPMETVGWSLFTILSQEEVEKPTAELREGLQQISDQAISKAGSLIRGYNITALLMSLAAIAVAVLHSYRLSKKIVEPIRKLTNEVTKTDGDNLDFTWTVETGDEIETLGNSFQSLTERMKSYIHDIQVITSERERIQTELDLSARIQTSMLPSVFPPYPSRREFDIFATMKAARKVGGDFYDFFMIDDDHLYIAIADVSGKGVPAALFMMITKMILQNCTKMYSSVAEILAKSNELICANNPQEMFVTAWVGILEISTGKLTAANAGHEYPILMQPGSGFEIVKDKHGFVLGGMDGMKYREYELLLRPGAKLFVYTDGLPEATDPDQNMFGTDRLLEVLQKETGSRPMQVLNGVHKAVHAFEKKAEQFDDLTMLCLEYKGPQS